MLICRLRATLEVADALSESEIGKTHFRLPPLSSSIAIGFYGSVTRLPLNASVTFTRLTAEIAQISSCRFEHNCSPNASSKSCTRKLCIFNG